MPELPDVTVYLEALQSRLLGQTLERALLKNPFLLRTADPPLQSCEGRRVVAFQ
jgi:formamidopyrimidine-DNA glycosylase